MKIMDYERLICTVIHFLATTSVRKAKTAVPTGEIRAELIYWGSKSIRFHFHGENTLGTVEH